MLRRAGHSFRPHFRRLHSQAASSVRNAQHTINTNRGFTMVVAVTVASTVMYTTVQTVYNDSTPEAPSAKEQTVKPVWSSTIDPKELQTLVWGSNTYKTLSPDDPLQEPIRVPSVAKWLNNVALRDLVVHEKHAACIDARGDVYQWGDGFFTEGPKSPKLTLRGQNIVQLQATELKLYALSASGRIYVLAANEKAQELSASTPTPSSDSWWSTGWLWGEDEAVGFAEVHPKEALFWNEKIVQISAGENHLLALTSKGRAYAHPVNKNANEYGQLGFRKIDISEPHAPLVSAAQFQVELVPKSVRDPYSKASRAARLTTSEPTPTSNILSAIDDISVHFCPILFEIPVLRGVNIMQLAAGRKTSFARTSAGRVLGWGANEYGQIGLGSNVNLDTIVVPTEVTLWKTNTLETRSACTNVTAGGDLTSFTVEHKTGSFNAVDVLMCGNGQYGGLGNNTYSNAQSTPVRVKNVSGLMQYNDKAGALEPIVPDEIDVSSTGHVLLTLNSAGDSSSVGGRDLMLWGKNFNFELGNGKRSSAAGPITLHDSRGERLTLMNRKAGTVRDLKGKVWKNEVEVEQHIATGYGNSVVYWKIAA
ncbi:regulator of chromosome condensation 1/beta-lactamase-inhibitor protein II [Cyathus striatus]|nr:regulator of chromosome condensation 1/beta-lactamase-inhibitor protein II [Cyathus striatus]